MITCTRRIEFDYGHRVFKHSGKCRHVHGHRGVLEITAESDNGLDDLGMVIDFSLIKSIAEEWILANWDHNFLVFKEDQLMLHGLSIVIDSKKTICDFNPTAENMASYFLHSVCPILFDKTGIRIVKVRLYETPNCYAEATI